MCCTAVLYPRARTQFHGPIHLFIHTLTRLTSPPPCFFLRRSADILQTVFELRQQRHGMIQTMQQYGFCYEVR